MIYKTGSLTALQYINHWRSPRGCWTYTYDNTDSLSFYVSFALSFPLFSLFLSLSIYLFFISPLYNFLSYCQLFCHDSVSPLSFPLLLSPYRSSPPPLFFSLAKPVMLFVFLSTRGAKLGCISSQQCWSFTHTLVKTLCSFFQFPTNHRAKYP